MVSLSTRQSKIFIFYYAFGRVFPQNLFDSQMPDFMSYAWFNFNCFHKRNFLPTLEAQTACITEKAFVFIRLHIYKEKNTIKFLKGEGSCFVLPILSYEYGCFETVLLLSRICALIKC